MNVTIPPELVHFVEDQVRSGRFASPSQVIEAGLARLMLDRPSDGEELDDETVAAIEEADAQIDRGEGMDAHEAFARLRAKYCPPDAP